MNYGKTKNGLEPLPEPKKSVSLRMKSINKATSELKKKLGVRGELTPGALINKSKTPSKQKLAIKGLV